MVFFGLHEWKHVPTSDVNTTFGLALGVWFLMIYFGIKAKGLGGGSWIILCPVWTKHLGLASKLYI